MKLGIFRILALLAWISCRQDNSTDPGKNLELFTAADDRFRYTGRVDFSNPVLPRFWAPGVYIETRFEGSDCQLLINDEEQLSKNHNYIQVMIDGKFYSRIRLSKKRNVIDIARGLDSGAHTLLICKGTESGIGYLEFVGLKCRKLLAPARAPLRKIEFIGNSITCGTGSDILSKPCGEGEWYDQHNTYYAYGPLTARMLKAQWHLTSVTGIGLMQSCCELNYTMPQVYNNVTLRPNSIAWDTEKYHPDVITVSLGQNDGIQDKTVFRKAYVKFVNQLRAAHPASTIFLLTSPMATPELVAWQKEVLNAVRTELSRNGMKKIHTYFFSKRYHNGCGDHPDLTEHQAIAKELQTVISNAMNW
ncbi:SGNH/GDSL hydrolase family protein [Flavihumibacter solisilvae]|uniref:Acetyl xylan esterase n=1 Tax=Flavihumibacter solisilvae TaxID=1349421 RepID=A0A0C1L3F7_9BACT|nr:SGNH/GDSL hydrolase family protein [Flavihumibacter solisilvae]KIC94136.1 acetyl xylan esterase [Flavihumibacter solisilvae]